MISISTEMGNNTYESISEYQRRNYLYKKLPRNLLVTSRHHASEFALVNIVFGMI
jgi:hypothetical protein